MEFCICGFDLRTSVVSKRHKLCFSQLCKSRYVVSHMIEGVSANYKPRTLIIVKVFLLINVHKTNVEFTIKSLRIFEYIKNNRY